MQFAAACRTSLAAFISSPHRHALAWVAIWSALVIAPGVALAYTSQSTPHTKHHRKHHRKHHKKHHKSSVQATQTTIQVCANANTSAASATVAEMDAAVACLINNERIERGLPALVVSSKLNNSAQSWTDQMVSSGVFSHGPGTSFANRIAAAGYDWQMAGENIATGFPTPSSVVSAWMASTGHCQNILDPGFRNVGTGESPQPVGGWASGPATWTQDFGLTMTQSPLSSTNGPMNGCPYSS